MEKDSKQKSSDKSRDKRLDNLKPFVKGKSGNPKGKKPGQRDYATIYRAALEKIAAVNKMTPEEFEDVIEQNGLKRAFSGNFAFFKDFRDRIHGTAPQKLEMKLSIDEEKRNKAKGAVSEFLNTRNTK